MGAAVAKRRVYEFATINGNAPTYQEHSCSLQQAASLILHYTI